MIYNYNDSNNTVYTVLWNKYRPSILKMMRSAEEGPQQYQFYSHEFKALKSTVKSFSFVLQMDNGKAVNSSKMSPIARDLVTVLQYSKTATMLMENQQFEFKLDRNFVLHVTRLTSNPASV